jgi:DEAD/DEAH box helicase domain-containing protein
MNPREFLAYLRQQPFYQGQIVHVEHLPARKARYGNLRVPLAPPIHYGLQRIGLERLWSHQAEAINAARAGHHVVVATGTASGKTLCYNLPVLDVIARDPRARALYLFPTKALAHDQLRALGELAQATLPLLRFGPYDGDTPTPARSRLRRSAHILLTNPDMLHVGILPHHTLWADFFRNLRFVVLDEAHHYRGVFGSQVACVLRRLRRICAYYGAQPQFIACSATIANPAQHLRLLTGLDFVVVDDDGSPRGPREFVLWNPPFVDRACMARRSANVEATFLFVELVRRGIRNITFARARKVAELILLYARKMLQDAAPELTRRVRAYRAGYLPEVRRATERAIAQGEIIGVTATNALELGVDIGGLDAVVMVGYPGTVASLWQQAGRAGRGSQESLAILIGLDNPLDQYFMHHPRDLFGRPLEQALADPDNVYVLERHLPCAARELPLRVENAPGGLSDADLFGPGFEAAMVNLEKREVLRFQGDRWTYAGTDYPAQHVSLRAMNGRRVAILNEADHYRTLEEIEAITAPFRVHPGAIYLHQGETYLVTELDLEAGRALVRPTEVDWYTQPSVINDVRILRLLTQRTLYGTTAYFGEVLVHSQVTGYRRLRQYHETVLGQEALDLPVQTFETQALWWDVPPQALQAVNRARLDFLGGLHAVEHAAVGILPLFAMCDRWDVGGLSTSRHPDTDRPQVFIYDGFPGGVGIAQEGFRRLAELWRAALAVIRDCPCDGGCPSCIQSPKCGNNNDPLDKEAARLILQTLLTAPSEQARI